jgi:hypothetical protein
MNEYIDQIGDRFYLTAQARIVEKPSELPREMASAFPTEKTNPSFVWIAGRYVQGEKANRNGHFWTSDDLKAGESTIKHTPLNVLHKFDRPVGTFVETKVVSRPPAEASHADYLPEIQALSVVWGANFPEVAAAVKTAHDSGQLWYSMECVAEQVQCLDCERTFAWTMDFSQACDHLSSDRRQPRRFINPTFLGGGLIFPPSEPGWSDADITEVAEKLTAEYAEAQGKSDTFIEASDWYLLMELAQSQAGS